MLFKDVVKEVESFEPVTESGAVFIYRGVPQSEGKSNFYVIAHSHARTASAPDEYKPREILGTGEEVASRLVEIFKNKTPVVQFELPAWQSELELIGDAIYTYGVLNKFDMWDVIGSLKGVLEGEESEQHYYSNIETHGNHRAFRSMD